MAYYTCYITWSWLYRHQRHLQTNKKRSNEQLRSAQYAERMPFKCWSAVYDAVPTLKQTQCLAQRIVFAGE